MHNLRKNPVHNFSDRQAGGWGPVAKGRGDGTPANIFKLFFKKNDLTSRHADLQQRTDAAPSEHAGVPGHDQSDP